MVQQDAGKSSLINLIPRFFDVSQGEVLVDGVNVKEYNQEFLHNKIGYVPQKAVMFSDTVKGNVGYRRKWKRKNRRRNNKSNRSSTRKRLCRKNGR